jgi:hypothetical protein
MNAYPFVRKLQALMNAEGIVPRLKEDGKFGDESKEWFAKLVQGWQPRVQTDPVVKGATLIPFATQAQTKMKTRGVYQGGWPRGAVVHFTAGRYEKGLQSAISTIEGGIKDGFTFLCIAYTGELVQAHPVNAWGYHAGESAWKHAAAKLKLTGTVSDELIGIEINNPGLLKEQSDGTLKSWFGVTIPKSQCRYVTEAEYGCPTGWYMKFSEEQEAKLVRTLRWLKANDPTGKFSFDLVLGHHEVAGKLGIGRWRKNDPGGALSMPMEKFREMLKTT